MTGDRRRAAVLLAVLLAAVALLSPAVADGAASAQPVSVSSPLVGDLGGGVHARTPDLTATQLADGAPVAPLLEIVVLAGAVGAVLLRRPRTTAPTVHTGRSCRAYPHLCARAPTVSS